MVPYHAVVYDFFAERFITYLLDVIGGGQYQIYSTISRVIEFICIPSQFRIQDTTILIPES